MKNIVLLFIFLMSLAYQIQAQTSQPNEQVTLTTQKGKTQVTVEGKNLRVNVSPKAAKKIAQKGFVQYSDFGAKGDGKTDDIQAIVAAHAYANQLRLPVKANNGASYYIGGKDWTAIIETDTDFGTAQFTIDDTDVENYRSSVFMVKSNLQPFRPKGITSLQKNQPNIGVSLPQTCILTVTDTTIRRYIRFGNNQNDGRPQTDIFVADPKGQVDMTAPIIWDFDQITDITALPIDDQTLTIRGGRFMTISRHTEEKTMYYARNIAIRRSRVVVEGLQHTITGETEVGPPYGGFINISDCAYITVKNSVFTGHKTYWKMGKLGTPVPMGTYDIQVNRALNVSFVNCTQTNDIHDNTYWGIMASNYSKNLLYDSCILSRFDAHMGVFNATIRNSTIGHQGINAIGSGTLTVENSNLNARTLVNLRSDYGSTWQGEFVIRNCVFKPAAGKKVSASLIGGSYSGQHDFGYTCYMPERIIFENLRIDDANHPDDYEGATIFQNFNPEMRDSTYVEKFPYIKTKEVILRNVTTTSGKALILSHNPFMFNSVDIMQE